MRKLNHIKTIPTYTLIALFLLTLTPQALAQVTVTVVTDRLTYVAGNWVSVSGTVSQVTPGVAVTIEIKKPDGTTWAYDVTTPSPTGAWSITNINRVSATDPVGTYTVTATYGTLGSASTTFTVAAPVTISLTPNKMTYNLGDTVTITGTVSRVEPGQQVTVEIKKPDGTTWAYTTATPAADGKWTAANINTFTATDPTGTYTITATYLGVQQSTTVTYTGRVIVSSLEIKSVALTPSTVQPGATYTISVSVSNNVTTTSVTANGTALNLTTGTPETGTWTATLKAPTTPGTYTIQVRATDTTGKTVTATTTLTVVLATITLEPNFGVPGSTIEFAGTNFTPQSTVTLTIDYQGLSVKLASAKATVTGTVSGTFKTPPLPAGVYTVTASDGTRTATAKLGIGVLTPSTLTIQVSTASQTTPGSETTAYILTTSEGAPVDVAFKLAQYTAPFLSKPVTLPTPTRIATGLYQITFKAPTQTGAYLIQVEAEYTNPDGRTVSASGQTVLTIAPAPLTTTDLDKATSDIKSTITESQKAVTKAVTDTVTSAQTDIKAAITTSQKAITDATSSAQTALASSIKSVEDAVKAAQSDIKAAVSSAQTTLSGSISGVKSSVDKLTDTVNNINTGIATTSTFTLVVTALVVITLVIEIVILIRRR